MRKIIRWEIYRDTFLDTMKIHQLAFIQDLIIKKEITTCNANVIPIKAGLSIEMTNLQDYEKVDLYIY